MENLEDRYLYEIQYEDDEGQKHTKEIVNDELFDFDSSKLEHGLDHFSNPEFYDEFKQEFIFGLFDDYAGLLSVKYLRPFKST